MERIAVARVALSLSPEALARAYEASATLAGR